MDQLYQLSLDVARWLQQTYPQLQGFMAAVSALGDELFFLVALPAVYWSVNKRLGRQLGYIFLLSVATNNIVKNALRQPRPFWLEPGLQLREVEGYGAPSGHVQNTTAVLFLLATRLRRWWVWLPALAAILAMALSRLYLGLHFLQDALIGFLLGVVVWGSFLFWQRVAGVSFSKLILGRRLLWIGLVPVLLTAAYVAVMLILGPPNTNVAWAARLPAAELNAHEDAVAGIAGLFGFGLGMILESSRIRFRADGPIWKRIVRYLVGIAVAVSIWAGLRAVFPTQPEWAALPLRFVRYFVLLMWVTYFAPGVFVRLRLAAADLEPEVRVTL